MFGSEPWQQFVSKIDLQAHVGGKFCRAEASYLPAWQASGSDLYFVYSLERFFFENWIAEGVRLRPERADHYAQLGKWVRRLAGLIKTLGQPLDRSILVVNPLSYRSDWQAREGSLLGDELDRLKAIGKKEKSAVWIPCLREETHLHEPLSAAGFSRLFFLYDHQIDLTGINDFDSYLHQFRRTTRRAFERDIKRTSKAGIRFEHVADFSNHSELFAGLYESTYAKYGESHFHHGPSFWKALSQNGDFKSEAILALHGEKVVGFNVLIHDEARKELWTYRMGKQSDESLAGVPFYFPLCFYEPIKRALELGCQRVWLGPAGHEAKCCRGAKLVPLFSYIWTPTIVGQSLLIPYLKLFSKVSRKEIEASLIPHHLAHEAEVFANNEVSSWKRRAA